MARRFLSVSDVVERSIMCDFVVCSVIEFHYQDQPGSMSACQVYVGAVLLFIIHSGSNSCVRNV